VYDAVRSASGASLIIDASKGYLPGIAVYQARPAATRLILLTRDGRAVFHSNLKRGFGRSYSLKVWRNFYRYGVPLISKNVNRDHVLHVRYEDLASRPELVTRRICEFAGLEFETSMLDTRTKAHHITSGNNMRFRAASDIRPDTSWHSQLGQAEREYFERHAGSFNRQLGYEWRRNPR